MSNAKGHHKVPRFYLSGFTDPDRGTGKRVELWVYRRGDTAPTPMKPAKTVFENHFNSLTLPDGTRDASVEDWLAKNVDFPTSKLWPGMADRSHILSSQERAEVSQFLAFLVTRTESIRDGMNNFVDEACRKGLRIMAAHHEDLLRREHPASELSKEEMLAVAGQNGLFSLHHNEHVANIFVGVAEISALFRRMR